MNTSQSILTAFAFAISAALSPSIVAASIATSASDAKTILINGSEALALANNIASGLNAPANRISLTHLDCRGGIDLSRGRTFCSVMTPGQAIATISGPEAIAINAILTAARSIVFKNPANRLRPELGDMIAVRSLRCSDASGSVECEIQFRNGGGALGGALL